jgi:hypothetical protein
VDEEVRTITGNITVRAGFSLVITDSNITIACTFPEEFGIAIESGIPDDGSLEMSGTDIGPADASNGWTFDVDGSLYMHNDVKLFGVAEGVQIFTDDVRIHQSEIHAVGLYGVYIYESDPDFFETEIYNVNDLAETWSGSSRNVPDTYAIYIEGSSSHMAAPTFLDTKARVKLMDNWSRTDGSYTSIYERTYVYGFYADYADLGTLSGLNVSLDVTVDAYRNYTGTYSYPRFYNYMYAYGIYLTGGTYIDGFSDVLISDSNYLADVEAKSMRYLYNYFNFYGLYNGISSLGQVNNTLSGLTITGHELVTDHHNSFPSVYDYTSGRAIRWSPSSSAVTSNEFIIEDVTIDRVSVERIFEFSEYWDMTLRNSTIINNKMGSSSSSGSMLYLSYWNYDVTVENNNIINNTFPGSGYVVYFYRSYERLVIENNYVSDNTFYHFLYSDYSYASSNVFMRENEFIKNTVKGYTIRQYRSTGEMEVSGNNFTDNTFSSYFVYAYYTYSDGDLYLVDNMIMNNSASSYMFHFERNSGDVTLTFNNITSNSVSSYFVRAYYAYGDILWDSNEIGMNTASSYFMYLYYCQGDITFKDNEFIQNTASSYFMYAYQSRGDLTFERNLLFKNKGGSYFMYMQYTYGKNTWEFNKIYENTASSYFMYMYQNYGKITIQNNEIVKNTVSSVFMYIYYVQTNGGLDYKYNLVANNSVGYLLYSYYRYAPVNILDNDFSGNKISYYFAYLMYPQSSSGDLIVKGNNLTKNSMTNNGFYIYYPGRQGSDFEFEENNFYNNTVGTSYSQGMIYIYYPYMPQCYISNNYFEGNRGNMITLGYSYSSYVDEIIVDGNEFINNSGKGIYMGMVNSVDITITGNKGSGNLDYPVYMDIQSYSYRGPNNLIVQNNNFSDNPGGGMFFEVTEYNPSYSGNYFNPDQYISIKKNRLTNNGPGGWALAVINCYKRPTLRSNDWTGSAMGQYLGLSPHGSSERFTMNLNDIVVDGDDDGVTAYGFNNIDANFYDCKFTNFTETLFAKDCTVNTWASWIPEASGRTEGKGRIYVWNYLEILVTWANNEEINSGHPVNRALVALRGANGEYFGGLISDSQGRLEPMLINPWTSIEGEMNAISPFEVTILAYNVSTAHSLPVLGDLIGDNLANLVLVDNRIPELLISNPQDDTLENTVDVLAEGFLFEIGSGIVIFEGRSDVMEEGVWNPITSNVLWEYVFEGLDEGPHNLSVRSSDLSGNWNRSNVSIMIDITDPLLEIHFEYVDATPIPYNETLGRYFVRAETIVINGTYSANIATLTNVTIRMHARDRQQADRSI